MWAGDRGTLGPSDQGVGGLGDRAGRCDRPGDLLCSTTTIVVPGPTKDSKRGEELSPWQNPMLVVGDTG